MRRLIAISVMTGALLTSMLALPAFATGSFDWSGEFTHRLQSRTYTTNNTGTHTVTKKTANCPGPGTAMVVRLVHEVGFGSDDFYSWKPWNCSDTNQSQSWSSARTDQFHFDVQKSDTSDTTYTWTVTGSTTYP